MTTFQKIHALLTPAERKRVAAMMGLMVIGMGLETLGLGLIVPAIALLTQENLGNSYPALRPMLHMLGDPSHHALILIGLLTLVGIYFIKAIYLAFLLWQQARFTFEVQAQLSQRLFTAYLRQPYTFHLQRNSAQLIRNVVTEVAQFTGNAIGPGMVFLTEILVVIGIAVLLLVVEPIGALIAVVVLGGLGWGFYSVTRARITRWGEARQLHEGLRIQHLQQGLGGAKDVKLLGREEDFLAQFGVHNVKGARANLLQATLQQMPRLWLEVLAVAGLATLVLTMLAQGRPMGTIVPTLALFAAAAFRLMPSANRVLGAVQSLRFGLPVVNVLYAELQLAVPDPVKAVAEKTTPFARDVVLTEVTYSYPAAASPALRSLSLKVSKGESLGIIGPSGSGKSTLVDVVMGLLSPTTGTVTVDGEDIARNLRGWQNQIGYVPQSIYLTDDTLRRNVGFGLPDAQIDDAAVRRSVKAAQLDEFASSLPKGLETIVGERGIRLSGGQRQRIGIARALYHDPPVLVLDEATSALDTAIERGVMEAVAALRGSKTLLIVAHRLSTVEHCTRLCRIEGGRIVDERAPEDLLDRKHGAPMQARG